MAGEYCRCTINVATISDSFGVSYHKRNFQLMIINLFVSLNKIIYEFEDFYI